MRKHKTRFAALVFTALAAVQVGTVAPASAHNWDDHYNSYYANNVNPMMWYSDRTVLYRFTTGFPNTGTNHRQRVKDGMYQWGKESYEDFQWFYGGAYDYGDFDPLTCPGYYQKNGIHWLDINSLDVEFPNALGINRNCYITQYSQTNDGERYYGEIWSSQVIIDKTRSWYVGSNESGIGPTQYDLMSVASHEAGHGTGWATHFAATDCLGADVNTMCTGTGPANTSRRYRNLHDIHTFYQLYGT